MDLPLATYAAPEYLDDDGYVRVIVKFNGTVHLKHDDPVLSTQSHQNRMCCGYGLSHSEEDEARQARLEAYTAAKQTARANNQPIPTLAEWDAAQLHPRAAEMDA
ncbi:hypothetical protein LTR36_008873 [Oleoguttula mirabilis]|uniref:Uncharacterized protein n=1 Tax=Oleoguttula mirabilis TaxID=1507867 RepID=A0AAV9J702_9PEZI|nr:hypothetical protein LTR36_008873 [Oleoguttula mirabilis]